jgi:MoaA/NifB/PqqE/SkfB family radical SAM enzyme
MKPLTCNYYLTYNCNLTCEYCCFWKDRNLQKEQTQNWENIVHNLKILYSLGIKYLNICGGEPLMVPDLDMILRGAKELKFKIALSTNCTLYPERAGQIRGLVDNLYFSLDGPTKEINDEIRGGESFDKVLESIRCAKGCGEQPIINFTVTPNNIQYLPEMVEFAGIHKLRIKINLVFDYGEGPAFTPESLEHIKYYFKRKSVLLNLAEIEFAKRGGNKRAKPRCRAVDSTINISPSGKVMAPCFYFQDKKIELDKSVLEKLRKNRSIQGKSEICEGCQRWPAITPSFWCWPDKLFWLQLWSFIDYYIKRSQYQRRK